jgi:hypothetical protein
MPVTLGRTMESTSQDAPMPDRDRVRRRVLWVALLVLALVPFAIIDGPGADVLSRLGLVDEDETFTELFLSDRAQDPGELTPGGPIAFDFGIHNHEGEPTSYEWQVLFESASSASDGPASTVLDRGELRLDDDEEMGVHVEAVAPDSVGPSTVSVVLVGRGESIHFPVAVTGD